MKNFAEPIKDKPILWDYYAARELSYLPERGLGYTYGIVANGSMSNGWKIIEAVHRISENREVVEDIAALLTKHQIPLSIIKSSSGELLHQVN
ncbi:MAG: hypothetical protein RSC51_04225 [Oscillospiraceae bacterium]